jgi:hypothetical protein
MIKRTIHVKKTRCNSTHSLVIGVSSVKKGGRSRIRGKHIPIFRGSWQTRADQSQRIGEAQSGSGLFFVPFLRRSDQDVFVAGREEEEGGRGEWRETNTGNHFRAAFLREIPSFLPRKRTPCISAILEAQFGSAQPMVLDQTKALNFRSPLCFFLLKLRAVEQQNDQACVIK